MGEHLPSPAVAQRYRTPLLYQVTEPEAMSETRLGWYGAYVGGLAAVVGKRGGGHAPHVCEWRCSSGPVCRVCLCLCLLFASRILRLTTTLEHQRPANVARYHEWTNHSCVYRVDFCWQGPEDDECCVAMKSYDPKGPLVMYVVPIIRLMRPCGFPLPPCFPVSLLPTLYCIRVMDTCTSVCARLHMRACAHG